MSLASHYVVAPSKSRLELVKQFLRMYHVGGERSARVFFCISYLIHMYLWSW